MKSKPMDVFLDFETRSELNVKDVGASVYSRHPSTDVMCLAVDYGGGAVLAMDDYGFIGAHRDLLHAHALNPDVVFHAHNAAFEIAIWSQIMVKRYGMPEIPIHRWRCTAAKAAAFSLPRDLKGLGLALNLDVLKDDDGHKVMMKLTKPRRNGSFWRADDTPEEFDILYQYCIQDVNAERAADRVLPDLSKRKQKLWFLDQKINQRGVRLDLDAVRQVLQYIEATQERLLAEFKTLTRGFVQTPSQVAEFRKWLAANGCDLADLQAATVEKALKRADLPDAVRKALEIRQATSKISTAKYKAMMQRVDADGRIRDLFLFCAAITHRWGGRGVQVHNMPRPAMHADRSFIDSDRALDFIMDGDFQWFNELYADPMPVFSTCVRGVLIPDPDCEFYVSDFKSVEAVVLPWLAGQEDGVEVFRRKEDPYCIEAGGIFGRPVGKKDKYERSVGKVSVLALGYGGGIGAFSTMAASYSVDISPAYALLWPSATTDEQERARSAYSAYVKRGQKTPGFEPLSMEAGYAADIIKQRWRRKNNRIVQYWYDLENAAIQAVLTGEKQTVSDTLVDVAEAYVVTRPTITYGMMGEHLLCKLPSGNCIVYPFARVSMKETEWGTIKQTLSYKTQNETNYQYDRTWTYGGKLAENCIAEGTEVLTQRGWVCIETVRPDDVLWDGVEWVSHSGLLYKGDQDTIEVNSVSMTSDHEVLTERGWMRGSEIRYDWLPAALPDGYCGSA